jgi:two-component sensor histidine kinase
LPLLSVLQSGLLPARPGAVALALGVAVGVAAPTVLRMAVDPLLGQTLVYPTFYPAVLFGTLLLGWRGGLAILLLSAVAANYFFLSPRYHSTLDGKDIAGGAVFLMAGGLIMVATALLRVAIARLQTAHAHEVLLNKELQHRMKNTLAIVQSLVAHTSRRSLSDPQEFRAVLESRLLALASAHDLLAEGQWNICELPDLATRALAPFAGGGKVRTNGPVCTLRAECCVPLVLCLHELATNAVKHGALGAEQGSVELTWRQSPDANPPEILLRWVERGGPEVGEPTQRGLGRRLLRPQPGLEAIDLHFRPTGVECEMRVQSAHPSHRSPLATIPLEAALTARRSSAA